MRHRKHGDITNVEAETTLNAGYSLTVLKIFS